MTETALSGSRMDSALPENTAEGVSIAMVEEASNENMTPVMKDLLSVAQSSVEVLVGLLQILMAECGLFLAGAFEEEKNRCRNRPFFDVRILKELKVDISKNADGVYTNNFLLRGYSEPFVQLLCDPKNNNLLVSAVISSLKCVFSVVLKTHNYIVETSKNSFLIFNMKSLSIKFKNSVALPVRASILNRLGVPNPSLEGLPVEVLNLIWKKVPQPLFLSPAVPQASAIFTPSKEKRFRMSWNKFYIAQASLMVVTSTTNTLSTKWADHLYAQSADGQMRPFTHPFVQACSSFFGELLCLLLYKATYPCRSLHCTTKANKVEKKKGTFNPLIFVIPAICDMIGTSVMYVGLNLTYASSYQMLRGGVIVFVAVLSMAFLGRAVSKKEWLGIFFTILGLAIIGLSNHFITMPLAARLDDNSIITGDLLIVLSTIIRAVELVYEEKFCVSNDIPPMQAVGWEGAFGFIILSSLLIPMSYIKVGYPFTNNAESVLEDFPDAVIQMANNKLIVLAMTGAVASTCLTNYAGVHITKQLTSTTRMVLETIPTLFVWLSSIYLGWQTFHPLQILGFVIITLGMCLYNDIQPVFLTYLSFFKRSDEENHLNSVVAINCSQPDTLTTKTLQSAARENEICRNSKTM